MVWKEEEEVKGDQGDHSHPPVLDGDHTEECDGLEGIITLHSNDKSIYET